MTATAAIAMLTMTMALAAVASAAERDGGAWRAAAEEVLLPALRERYPGVEEWTVQPLVGRRQGESLQALAAPQGRVVQLGKRSAVKLTEQGRAAATLWFDVAGTQPVLVMKESVRAGGALAAQLAEPLARDVLSVPCTALTEPAALEGMRAKRSLEAGGAVCAELIEPRPAVARGEEVTVIAVAGPVSITTRAIAQQDGAIGQVLRVKSSSSGEVYLAAVSKAGEVVVHE